MMSVILCISPFVNIHYILQWFLSTKKFYDDAAILPSILLFVAISSTIKKMLSDNTEIKHNCYDGASVTPTKPTPEEILSYKSNEQKQWKFSKNHPRRDQYPRYRKKKVYPTTG
jgi:hypothetical protein